MFTAQLSPLHEDAESSIDSEEITEDANVSDHLSPSQAIFSVIKCAVGAGSFTIPKQFFDCGIMLSLLMTVVVGFLSCYTLCILLQSEEILLQLNVSKSLENKRKLQFELEDLTLSGDCDELKHSDIVSIVDNLSEQDDTASTDNRHLNCCAPLSYPGIGALTFPEFTIQCFGTDRNMFSDLIVVGIVFTSLGVSAAYVDFIASTLPEIIRNFAGGTTWLVRETALMIIAPILFGLSYLRNFKSLLITSILGDLAVLSGCVTVLIFGGFQVRRHNEHELWNQLVVMPESSAVPKFIGSTTFLFAIHVVILPIMQQLREHRLRKKCTRISYGLLTVFNAAFGISGCCLYAKSICKGTLHSGTSDFLGPCGNILGSIGDGIISDMVKLLVCVDLLFTAPLVLAASREIIEPALIDSYSRYNFRSQGHMYAQGMIDDISVSQNSAMEDDAAGYITDTDCDTVPRRWCGGCKVRDLRIGLIRYATRTALVTAVIAIAVGVPNFGDMVDLVGGIVCALTGYILPPLIYLRLESQQGKTRWWSYGLHLSIAAFGLSTLVITIYFAVT